MHKLIKNIDYEIDLNDERDGGFVKGKVTTADGLDIEFYGEIFAGEIAETYFISYDTHEDVPAYSDVFTKLFVRMPSDDPLQPHIVPMSDVISAIDESAIAMLEFEVSEIDSSEEAIQEAIKLIRR